jgi:hypothetical protein
MGVIRNGECDCDKMFARIEKELDELTKQEYEGFIDLKEHALDFIDTYENDEIAQMVREGVLTIEEVEDGLRRSIA